MILASVIHLISCFIHFGVLAKHASHKIEGPTSFQDKIAIVGAGPSGVHMAYLLKKKGFKNIHILEKSARIGGKSFTVHHRNMTINMGTINVVGQHVFKLAMEFVPNDIDVTKYGTFYWTDASPHPIKPEDYATSFAQQVLGPSYDHVEVSKVNAKRNEALIAFNRLREKIFGSLEKIPPRPSAKNLRLAQGSSQEFLVRNNLTILLTDLYDPIPGNGYGHMEEFPALYLLLNWKPQQMVTLRSGFQNLWETIVRREKLHVKFNVDILSVDRNLETGNKAVWLFKREGTGKPRWERYDFLIWSPEMKISMDRWENYIPIERELFSGTIARPYTSSIVDIPNFYSEYSENIWIDNNIKNRQNVVSEVTRKDSIKKPITTYVTYQPSLYKAPINYLKTLLVNHFRHFGAKTVKIIKMKTWRYFPRYSSSQLLDGCLWKILEIQGKYGMWYIGGSVWFESVPQIIAYNTHLVDNMVVPKTVQEGR